MTRANKKTDRINIKAIYKKNKTTTILFLFSTIYLLLGHYIHVNWDFAAYVLNAKYWFSDGVYFELIRPPLTQFIIGIFGAIINFKPAEYLYILFVSLLHLFASRKFCKSYEIDHIKYYAFTITPYFLFYGTSEGTELLSLSLLELFLAYIAKTKGGMFLSLACLTRYNNFSYILLLLYNKKVKKIIKPLAIFILTFSPWLIYNQIKYKNPLTSIANNYAQNILLSNYLDTSINPIHFAIIIGTLAPLFILGLAKCNWKNRKNILILSFLLLTMHFYIFSTSKIIRFLYHTILPISYFSTIGLESINKHNAKKIFNTIITLNILISIYSIQIIESEDINYPGITKQLDSSCTHMSNDWVKLNYYGLATEPSPHKGTVKHHLDNGHRIILFKHLKEPAYTADREFLKTLPVITDNEEYILLGYSTKCQKNNNTDQTYLENLNETIYIQHNYSINIDPYFILNPFTKKEY